MNRDLIARRLAELEAEITGVPIQWFGGAEAQAAARRATRIAEAIYAFTDRYASRWVSLREAQRLVGEALKKASHTERCQYLNLLNKHAQAWNAWARLAGLTAREKPLTLRSMVVVVYPHRVTPVFPDPVHYVSSLPGGSTAQSAATSGGPRPKREAPYDTEGSVGSGFGRYVSFGGGQKPSEGT